MNDRHHVWVWCPCCNGKRLAVQDRDSHVIRCTECRTSIAQAPHTVTQFTR